MNYGALDTAFEKYTEYDLVRLMTADFNEATYSELRKHLPNNVAGLFEEAMRFRTHLVMEKTTYGDLLDKVHALAAMASEVFQGCANKPFAYAGKHLNESSTLCGTPDELVSNNEVTYLLKMYPWPLMPVNEAFNEVLSYHQDKKVFICLSSFNTAELAEKEDVALVTEKHIVLKDKTKIPIVVVN